MAKHCDRVFSSKVKQIMESQGHPLFWEGTKFQNENVYYMYCLDYIQSVKSILLHKPYLISTPPTFAGLLDKTKHSPLTDNAPDRRTGSETRVRYLPIVSIRESQVPCLRRQDVLHGLPSNHKALIFIETQAAVMLPPETLEEGKTMVVKTSRRCRRICAIFQAGRFNFFTSLREKHTLLEHS